MAIAITSPIPDVCVIGAGIFGLSVAWAARQRGLTVQVIEAKDIGAGASGGIVGALSPHIPEQWNPKKQFQFEALTTAEDHWTQIDARSGLSSGYGRAGRLMPLPSQAAANRALDRATDAQTHWGTAAAWSVLPPDAAPNLVPNAPFGLIHETLSARLHPLNACRALAAALRAQGVQILTHTPTQATPKARFETPTGPIQAGQIVLAAGVPGFDLLAPLLGQVTGKGVKGQAALLGASLSPDTPVIFDDGLYIVPHANGTTAIGSTSENTYVDAVTTDTKLDALIAQARILCPVLKAAPVLQRWAAARPKARRRDPMLGPVPDHPSLFLATGAFKIGFGIAHKVGAALADCLTDQDPHLPESFIVTHHMDRADAPDY